MNTKLFRQIVVGILALLMILGCILPALAAEPATTAAPADEDTGTSGANLGIVSILLGLASMVPLLMRKRKA